MGTVIKTPHLSILNLLVQKKKKTKPKPKNNKNPKPNQKNLNQQVRKLLLKANVS